VTRWRTETVVTAGTLTVDEQAWEVETNVWLVGDDEEVLVIDPAHDLAPILSAIGGRRTAVIACTHGHSDHIDQAPALASETGAEVVLHPKDRVIWDATFPDRPPDGDLVGGEVLRAAGLEMRILETPGHTPGSVSLYVPPLEEVFTGDTLLAGGPGAVGLSHSDFDTIVTSIKGRILALPPQTRILPGHGPETTVKAEAPLVQDWAERMEEFLHTGYLRIVL
jgi:glyoxylase-like metal-dependent hydrolase (beta-lactamase superfamily II)